MVWEGNFQREYPSFSKLQCLQNSVGQQRVVNSGGFEFVFSGCNGYSSSISAQTAPMIRRKNRANVL